MKAELPTETQNCLLYFCARKCQRSQLSTGDVHTQDCPGHKVKCILCMLEASQFFALMFSLIYFIVVYVYFCPNNVFGLIECRY